MVLKTEFDEVKNFSEGLAAVAVGEKWGYINRAGRLVIKPQFDFASKFSQGLAQVTIDGKLGYIDRAGKKIWFSAN